MSRGSYSAWHAVNFQMMLAFIIIVIQKEIEHFSCGKCSESMDGGGGFPWPGK